MVGRHALIGCAVLAAGLAAPAAGQTFSGSGQEATRPFALIAGLAVFEMEHRGEGAFLVRLMDDKGNVVGEVANAQGVFGGSRALRVAETGRYLLDVVADGRWSVRLRSNDVDEDGAPDPSHERGLAEGTRAGGQPGTFGWAARGFLGGLLAGPVGTGIAVSKAGSSTDGPARNALAQLATSEGPGFTAGYRDGFVGRLSDRRKRSALFGGLVGTGVLAYVLYQAIDIGRPQTAVDPDPDNPMSIVVPIFRFN